MTDAVVRPKSLLFVAAVVVFTLAAVAWICSYAGTSYLDQGRLLVISGSSGDIVDVTFNFEDAVHNLAEARARLAHVEGWYALQDVAVRAKVRPLYREWFGGFGLGRLATPSGSGAIHLIAIPLWSIATPAGLLTVGLAAGSARAGRRVRGNRCVACGYDLRGSPGRCPECGATPAV